MLLSVLPLLLLLLSLLALQCGGQDQDQDRRAYHRDPPWTNASFAFLKKVSEWMSE
jgi:hypothetical protein